MSRFLVVGLGNPGLKYKKTRHNAGFMVVEQLAEEVRTKFKRGRGQYETAEYNQTGDKVILLKPHTYMNNSGIAVSQVINYYNIDLLNLLIVYDEIDLPLGSIRLRAQGGSGGHNGLNSVIQHLNTKQFARLRIGIGTEFAKRDMVDFVLSRFSRNEQKQLKEIISTGSDAVQSFVSNGIDKTMTTFNSL